MNQDHTHPLNVQKETKVLYRCSCGAELSLNPKTGGVCDVCKSVVSPKVLSHDLAMTMTIQSGIDPAQRHRKIDLSATKPDAGAQDDPDVLIGQTFGHFEIVDSLGAGGMGQVYRALDKSLQRYVAVKVLRSGIGSTQMTTSHESEIDALLQEAVSQARVTHPNIVTIYYVGKQDGSPFLAMELVSGNALSKLIEDGSLSFAHIIPIALQLARALQFSYQLDIIHGDIKPSNILVQANGLTKLSDFGMARRASDKDDKRIGGTPNYIAPDLLNGEPPSVQSDMYAVGVTLYEMTFGRLPVQLTGTTIAEWNHSHENRNIYFPTPWPENFPETWKTILVKLLAKDPKDRYESYEDLVAAIEKVKPESRIIAKRAPRLIAALIDWLLVLVLMSPIQLLTASNVSEVIFGDHWLLGFVVRLTDFIPIAIYTIVLFIWRQSVGRSMMHVRVVNRYGLVPPGNTMVLRSFFRMCVPWMICLMVYFDSNSSDTASFIQTAFAITVLIYWLLDMAFLAIYQNARSIHDLIFGTRVVIDTD